MGASSSSKKFYLRTKGELAHERGEDVQGKVRVVLEPDRIAHLPLAQARLDGHHQVLGAPPRDLHLGVACYPDPMRGEDLVAFVQPG